ncbi:hypothetical protein R5R35_002655 [Gryllus longicercus]|uniref:G-protein coupled receptors family 2 profile 2 domain-containing protein n=1 Tax=Gryllus longicercus TaxID=2509291 RepID=A0AAN9W1Z5_9ORTH
MRGPTAAVLLPAVLLLLLAAGGTAGEDGARTEAPSDAAVAAAASGGQKRVLYKCCEVGEVWVYDDADNAASGCHNATVWLPPDSVGQVQWERELRDRRFQDVQVGHPKCTTTQLWPLYHFENGEHDELELLANGRLRHYTRSHAPPEHPDLHYDRDPQRVRGLGRGGVAGAGVGAEAGEERPRGPPVFDLDAADAEAEQDALDKEHGARFFHDYAPGAYCVDRIVGRQFDFKAQYAVVCAPHVQAPLNGTDFIMKRIVNPVCHGIAIACYLLVAVLYFVLPQLRDLVGNMLTTLAICLIVSQAADLVSIFTQYTNHVSFLVADVVMYVSLLAAFFWLNSLGYYIWKTFRSRNVFLRVTDARKYCYYSTYAWGATLAMAVIALFAHFMLDTSRPEVRDSAGKQETIGRLGIAVFFTPIAFTILVNIFFYLTTGQAISRIATRGRIHHKMKYCFDMFVKLFLVMAVAWLFLVLARLPYDVLDYCNIVANLLQAFFFLYVTVLGQKRVTMLIKQAFCSNPEGQDTAEWGEEMSPMSSAHY